jgi:hypothetical protein
MKEERKVSVREKGVNKGLRKDRVGRNRKKAKRE